MLPSLDVDGRREQAQFVDVLQAKVVDAGCGDVKVERVVSELGFELRQLRTFAEVAQRRSFSRAADELGIAQQAVSQQIKTLERTLGVALLRRTSRRVELTADGSAFLADARRVLGAADSASRHIKAVARGEAGTLRLAYTFAAAWETAPKLLECIRQRYPQVRAESQEVHGADIAELLLAERFDLAIAPRTSYPKGLRSRAVRREPLKIALSKADRLARRKDIELATLADRLFENPPREASPGFFDTIVGYCRAAGFEPKLDEPVAGNTVWRNIARGHGVALINASVVELAPRGITLVNLARPGATMTFDAVWRDDERPLIHRVLEVASEIAKEEGWL